MNWIHFPCLYQHYLSGKYISCACRDLVCNMVKLLIGVVNSDGSQFAVPIDSSMSMESFQQELRSAGQFPENTVFKITRNNSPVKSLSELADAPDFRIPMITRLMN